jgi:hypothetical protein
VTSGRVERVERVGRVESAKRVERVESAKGVGRVERVKRVKRVSWSGQVEMSPLGYVGGGSLRVGRDVCAWFRKSMWG